MNNDGRKNGNRDRREERPERFPKFPEQWTYKGKPLKILSTSLGVALMANLLLAPAAYGEGTSTKDEPKLVKWSTDAVKAYFDPQMDWNIPLAPTNDDQQDQQSNGQGSGQTTGGTAAPVIIHNGFGWTDLMLYHMIFNSGRSYSSSDWYGSRRVYYPQTSTPVKPRTYNSDTFQNKPTTGSVVRPKTVKSSGSITRRGTSASSRSSRSTSSSRGSIGGRSGGFSSGFGG